MIDEWSITGRLLAVPIDGTMDQPTDRPIDGWMAQVPVHALTSVLPGSRVELATSEQFLMLSFLALGSVMPAYRSLHFALNQPWVANAVLGSLAGAVAWTAYSGAAARYVSLSSLKGRESDIGREGEPRRHFEPTQADHVIVCAQNKTRLLSHSRMVSLFSVTNQSNNHRFIGSIHGPIHRRSFCRIPLSLSLSLCLSLFFGDHWRSLGHW